MVKKYKQIRKDGKTILEHRKIMEEYIGRELTKKEVVHHINGNSEDNRIENLKVMLVDEHNKFEASKKIVTRLLFYCHTCGVQIKLRPKYYKRKKEKGVKNFFCSKSCLGKSSQNLFKPLDIDNLIKEELHNGLTGYKIAVKHKLNRTTVYNHIRQLKRKGLVA